MDDLTLATAFGSAQVAAKILGPTADYLGDGLKDFTEKRIDNVKRIFRRAEERLGDLIDQPGGVNPRVLKAVLDDGSFCEDQVAADYIGGVVANSRSEAALDDRGVFWLAIINRLSTYQLRSHYVMYRVAHRLLAEAGTPTWDEFQLERTHLFIPSDEFRAAFDTESISPVASMDLVPHAVWGLRHEGLIGREFAFGTEGLRQLIPLAADTGLDGLAFTTTVLGIQLYQWAAGLPPVAMAFAAQSPLELEEPIMVPQSAKLVSQVNVELATAPGSEGA